MKKFITFIVVAIIGLSAQAQKVTKVEVTTSADVETSMNACKEAGKPNGYGSRDFDAVAGKVTLWKNYGNVGSQLIIHITAAPFESGTKLTFVLPHIPANLDSYPRHIKKVISKLSLPDIKVGEYFTGIE